MLEQFKERAREDKAVVLSLLILRDRLCYACVYVLQGYIQKPPSILRDKLQHEARKHYGPSEVVKQLQLLRKQSNTCTSTRLAKFTWACCRRVCKINPALHICMSACRSLLFIQSLSLRNFVSFNCLGWWIFLA